MTEACKHFLNVEDAGSCSDLKTATVFKELYMAKAIVDTESALALYIAQISIDGDTRTMLKENCCPPVVKRLEHTLFDVSDVDIDADFESKSRRNILLIKGQNAFLRLILFAGGIMSAAEVSDLLGTETCEVRDLRDQGKLIALAFDEDDAVYYPLFQFTSRKNEVGTIVNNFSETLALLESESPIDSAVFFLTPDVDLDWDTPINALKRGENIEMFKRLAKQFGRQTAR